jgi:glyceraldehyde 3-phosphate dehydrogenase
MDILDMMCKLGSAMVKIGFHGLGRVGRAILRRCALDPEFEVVAVNELNPDADHIAYSLNYDSIYGKSAEKFTARDASLCIGDRRIRVLNESDVASVPWGELGVDCLIDASGGTDHAPKLRRMLESQSLAWAFTTGLDPASDLVLTLGANESEFRRSRHRLISSNTCDATAIAPVVRALDQGIGLEEISLAVLHPWLNHQNLLDARPPEGALRNYEVGRASHGNIIPKATSAESAIRAVLPGLEGRRLSAVSYRIPTPIVACADLSLRFARSTGREEVLAVLSSFQEGSRWRLLEINRDPLVSSDFTGNEHSAIIEERLLSVSGGRHGRLTLWYDNEAGYAARVIDQVRFCAAEVTA